MRVDAAMSGRYFGRPFESKSLKDLDGIDASFLRFRLGQGSVSSQCGLV